MTEGKVTEGGLLMQTANEYSDVEALWGATTLEERREVLETLRYEAAHRRRLSDQRVTGFEQASVADVEPDRSQARAYDALANLLETTGAITRAVRP